MATTLQDDPLQIRCDSLLEVFVNSLPQDKYSFTKPDAGEGLYFAISKKNHNGQHWGRLGALSLHQYRLMVSTSASDEEALQRLRDFIMEGKDTLRQAAPPSVPMIPLDQVQQMVRAAVEQALAATRPPQPPPSQEHGPYVPQLKKPKASDQKLLATWTERAKELGIEPPTPNSKGGVDGRWLRHAIEKWKLHQATTATSTPAT
jgi:hypothetical protein